MLLIGQKVDPVPAESRRAYFCPRQMPAIPSDGVIDQERLARTRPMNHPTHHSALGVLYPGRNLHGWSHSIKSVRVRTLERPNMSFPFNSQEGPGQADWAGVPGGRRTAAWGQGASRYAHQAGGTAVVEIEHKSIHCFRVVGSQGRNTKRAFGEARGPEVIQARFQPPKQSTIIAVGRTM